MWPVEIEKLASGVTVAPMPNACAGAARPAYEYPPAPHADARALAASAAATTSRKTRVRFFTEKKSTPLACNGLPRVGDTGKSGVHDMNAFRPKASPDQPIARLESALLRVPPYQPRDSIRRDEMNRSWAAWRSAPTAVLLAAATAAALSLVGGASASGGPAVNLDQCSNGSDASLTCPPNWQNGDLNPNNSAYAEG